MTCQGQRRGMFEQHRGRHPQAGGLGQALAQPDAGERVEAEFPEGRVQVDGVRRGVPEQGGDVPADQVRQDLLPLGVGAAGQAEGQGGRRLERPLLVRFVRFVRLHGLRHDDRPAAGLAVGPAVGPAVDLAVVAGGLGYGHVHPVAPADERVRRQAHRPAVLAGEHLVPVQRNPADVQADGGGEQCVGFGLVLGQRGHQGYVRGVRGRGGQAVLGQCREHTVRAEFQEGGDAVRLQLPDAVAEPHGLPDVAHPVPGRAQLRGGCRLAGDGRDDRDARRRERKALRHLAELGQHAVHQRRVRGKADPQPGDLAPRGLEMGGDGRGRRLLAGHHGRHRTVDRGDAQVLLAAGEQRQHLLLGGLQRDHRAARWKPVHQPSSCGHQRARVGEIQDAGGVGGGQFTEGVAEQETRMQAPPPHEPEQGGLQREQRRLRVVRAVEQLGVRRAVRGEDDVAHPPVEVAVQVRAHVVEGLGEGRETVVQLPAHTQPLHPLAGEQERHHAGIACDPAHEAGKLLPLGQGVQAAQQVGPVPGNQPAAVAEGRAGGRQRVGHVDRFKLGTIGQVRAQPLRLCPQRPRVPARQHPGHRPRRPAPALLPRAVVCAVVRIRRSGEQHMAVGAAHAERADTGDPAAALVRPLLYRHLHGQVQRLQRNPRIRRLEVQARYEFPVPDAQDGLHQSGDTGRTVEVPDVGLDRTHPQGRPARPGGCEHGAEGRGLHRVADLGRGAVHLDVLHVARVDAGPGTRLSDDVLLPGLVRGDQAVATAVVVDRAALDHAVDRVAVRLGPGKGFQDHNGPALAADKAVRARVEGVAPAVGRQRAEPVHGDGALGGEHEVHATDERDGALLPQQALAGQVDRDERGGLARVHDQARAPQPQLVRQPVRDDAAVQPGHGVLADRVGPAPSQHGGVVVPHRRDEHAAAGAAQRFGDYPGVLQRLPAEFQHQPLLRVHHRGLARGDAEELRVETVDLVEESAPPAAGAGQLAVEQAGRAPTLLRRLGDGGCSGSQQPPEAVEVGRCGQAAGHADDGDPAIRVHRHRVRDSFGIAHCHLRLKQGKSRSDQRRSYLSWQSDGCRGRTVHRTDHVTAGRAQNR